MLRDVFSLLPGEYQDEEKSEQTQENRRLLRLQGYVSTCRSCRSNHSGLAQNQTASAPVSPVRMRMT